LILASFLKQNLEPSALNEGMHPEPSIPLCTHLYYLTDHLGSMIAALDSSGSLLSQQRYLPFGEVRADVGAITQTDFGYTSQRNLAELGLMDYRARFYSPALGRFLQPDILVQGAGYPQTLNRYSYVTNQPILLNDPTGHFGQNGNICTDDGWCGDNTQEYLDGLIDKNTLCDLLPSTTTCGEYNSGDYNQNGIPEIPNPDWHVSNKIPTEPCETNNYVECFYSNKYLVIDGKHQINYKKWYAFLYALYLDISRRAEAFPPTELHWWNGMDYVAEQESYRHINPTYLKRGSYDTPFWDNVGQAGGLVCFGGRCFDRVAVNYIAQGMWSAAAGEGIPGAMGAAYYWKRAQWGMFLPPPEVLYWTGQGVKYYFYFAKLQNVYGIR